MDYKRVKRACMAGIDFDCCNIGSMRYEYSAYYFKSSDKSYV